jgi:hypothetical protein
VIFHEIFTIQRLWYPDIPPHRLEVERSWALVGYPGPSILGMIIVVGYPTIITEDDVIGYPIGMLLLM